MRHLFHFASDPTFLWAKLLFNCSCDCFLSSVFDYFAEEKEKQTTQKAMNLKKTICKLQCKAKAIKAYKVFIICCETVDRIVQSVHSEAIHFFTVPWKQKNYSEHTVECEAVGRGQRPVGPTTCQRNALHLKEIPFPRATARRHKILWKIKCWAPRRCYVTGRVDETLDKLGSFHLFTRSIKRNLFSQSAFHS